MREADDPHWSGEAKEWVQPTEGDDPGKGPVRVMKFNRPEIARRWIETTFADEFDEETHELVVEKGESYNWFYREGD